LWRRVLIIHSTHPLRFKIPRRRNIKIDSCARAQALTAVTSSGIDNSKDLKLNGNDQNQNQNYNVNIHVNVNDNHNVSTRHHLEKLAEATKHIAEVEMTTTIEDSTLEGLKAKIECAFPRAMASSIESMVVCTAAASAAANADDGIAASGIGSGGIVKEFTVSGNKLTPMTEESKKRPRGDHTIEDDGFDDTTCSDDDDDDDGDDDDIGHDHDDENEDDDDHDDEEDHDEEYSDDEDYDDDDEDHVIGSCLHCGLDPPPADGSISRTPTAPGIQVSCDDCHSFICSACHWCHEYQANHEIRVCDRCDAFYCKGCDEMDQCEDCGEVVCGGCGALCSCKFCGCGLCEDCATACGRCGIVLCARDAKFAVECDTCKMSYCLVCLASGTKDPCVRCGQRPSKRVEQLVHLRLKSIYKAFKQSGAALNTKGSANGQSSECSGTSTDRIGTGTVAVAGVETGNSSGVCETTGTGKNEPVTSANIGESSFSIDQEMQSEVHGEVSVPISSSENGNMHELGHGHKHRHKYAHKQGHGHKYGNNHGHVLHQYPDVAPTHASDAKNRSIDNDNIKSGSSGNGSECSVNGDLGAVLQVTAAAAASTASTKGPPDCENFSSQTMKDWSNGVMPRGVNPSKVVPHLNHDGSISFRPRKEPKKNESDFYAARTQAEADAAAASLLAMLDEEKQLTEASSKAKKSKKKKKKERQAAREKEKEERAKKEVEEEAAKIAQEEDKNKILKAQQLRKTEVSTISSKVDKEVKHEKKKKSKKDKKKDKLDGSGMQAGIAVEKKTSRSSLNELGRNKDDIDTVHRLVEESEVEVEPTKKHVFENEDKDKGRTKDDEVEFHLAKLISTSDLDGIETILAELKGVPGRAALRKNAKKAAKRIREEKASISKAQKEKEERHSISPSIVSGVQTSAALAFKPSEPLLKLVSSSHRVQSTSGGPPRSECVMHMAPTVVGWVIGKGGQRIRDLMEDSGAKVWIDQESMASNDMRIVYVSGSKKSIDIAVRTIKDLVANAPIGGSTQTSVSTFNNASVPHSVNDSASVASNRSSLTSTPIPFTQSFAQHQAPSPAKRAFINSINSDTNQLNTFAPSSSTNMKSQADIIAKHMSPTSRTTSMPPLGMGNSFMNHSISPPKEKAHDENQSIAAKAMHELTCEPRFVPLLIGRRGWTVKNIQDTSGARVDIDQNVNPRRIIISGEVEQVREAVRLVREVLSYPHAQLNYDSTSSPGEGVADVGGLRPDIFLSGELDLNDRPTNASSFAHIHSKEIFGENGSSVPLSFNQQSVVHNSRGMMPHCATPMNYGQPLNQSTFNNQIDIQQDHQRTNDHNMYGHDLPPHLPLSPPPVGSRFYVSGSIPNNLSVRNNEVQNHPSVRQPKPFNRAFLGQQENSERKKIQYDTVLPVDREGIDFLRMSAAGEQLSNIQHLQNSTCQMKFGNDSGLPTFRDQDIVNNLFGPSNEPPRNDRSTHTNDSLAQGFNSLSLRSGNDLGLDGANWDWEALMKDSIEDQVSHTPHRIGLGGVRLDTSEMPNNRDTSNSVQHPRWGM